MLIFFWGMIKLVALPVWSEEFLERNHRFALLGADIAAQCQKTTPLKVAQDTMQGLATRHHWYLQNTAQTDDHPQPIMIDRQHSPAVIATQAAKNLYQFQISLRSSCEKVRENCLKQTGVNVSEQAAFVRDCQAFARGVYETERVATTQMIKISNEIQKNTAMAEYHRQDRQLTFRALGLYPLQAIAFLKYKAAAERITGLIRNPKKQ